MLKAGAQLIGSALASQRLIAELENSNRLLSALGDMTAAMLKPGASRHEVIDAVVGHLTDSEVPEFDFNLATVYLLDQREDDATVVRMAAGAATAASIEGTAPHAGKKIPRWALEEDRLLAESDVLVYVARTWQTVIVGPLPAGDHGDVISGGVPVQSTWTEVPVVYTNGMVLGNVLASLIGEKERARGEEPAPFTLAGEVFDRGGHKDLIRVFVPFGSDATGRATGVLEVGYHRSDQRRPDWGQVEALRAAAGQLAVAVETARLYEDAQRHAEQLELVADVSKAIASSIDLEQTLTLVAQNLARLVDASLCQIALYEEDHEGWYGAAASDLQDLWHRKHAERSETTFLFDVLDREQPIVVDDTSTSSQVDPNYVLTFGVKSLMALPLIADEQAIGAAILAERTRHRRFTPEEVQRAQALAVQAAVAIKNARLHALAEEERHLQKDFVLIGFGQWGQKAYQHLLTLKQFFNFRTHVVEQDSPGSRDRLGVKEEEVRTHGDTFYWDSHGSPARDQLERELESSSYVITYIATPAATHLPTLARYYDLSPHAFAIISLLTPIDRIKLDATAPLLIGRHEGLVGQRESYARMNATFEYHGRSVRLVADVGKGAENAKWIKLSGEKRAAGRSPSYKFDLGKGEAIHGTQATLRAAVRRIRGPRGPDNAHLNMLRHVIEKRHPAVGILSIREAIRANQRVRDLEAMAVELLSRNEWTGYSLGTRPAFEAGAMSSVMGGTT